MKNLSLVSLPHCTTTCFHCHITASHHCIALYDDCYDPGTVALQMAFILVCYSCFLGLPVCYSCFQPVTAVFSLLQLLPTMIHRLLKTSSSVKILSDTLL